MSDDQLRPFDPDTFDAEFDCPFTLVPTPAGVMVRDDHEVCAPAVTHVDDWEDRPRTAGYDIDIEGTGWHPVTGWSGQYGLHPMSANMHASEIFRGNMARGVAEMATEVGVPLTVVLCVIEVLEHDERCLYDEDGERLGDDECLGDHEPAGWCALVRYATAG